MMAVQCIKQAENVQVIYLELRSRTKTHLIKSKLIIREATGLFLALILVDVGLKLPI